MAFSTRSSLFFFFTTLVLLSTHIHGRESYFFGKFHRENAPKDQNPSNVLPLETSQKTTVEDQSIPNKNEQEQDPTFVPQSENGYGLYGHETTYNDNKEEFNKNNKYDEKVNGETFSTPSLSETEEFYDEKYPTKTEQSFDSNGYNNEVFTNNNKYDEKYPKKTEQRYENNVYNNEEFNNNKYEEKYPKKTEQRYENNVYNNEEFNNNNKYDENVKEESLSENNHQEKRNFYNSNAYGSELERETPYKGYSHNLERQGMSDTRFMEKGNYYYDLYNDRNHGDFYRKTHHKSPSGYYTSPATDNTYDQSYSYGTNNYNNNNEEEKAFKDSYNSKWEKNMMNEQPEEFVEQGGDFKP